jgi:hypothetical protein
MLHFPSKINDILSMTQDASKVIAVLLSFDAANGRKRLLSDSPAWWNQLTTSSSFL